MIELGVEARRKRVPVETESPARFLVLGDFGGRAEANAIPIDRDNFDGVLSRFEVKLAGSKIEELDDFHPDRLYQRLDVFRDLREGDAPEAPSRPGSLPQADLERILRPSSLLDKIAGGGGDPFEEYVKELALSSGAEAAPARNSQATAQAATMRAVLGHPRFQTIEAAWRGLDFAVREADDESARIYVAQLSRKELIADLAEASDLKTTRLYGLLRSRAWSGVFGLYSFGADAEDIELLGRIALLVSSARTAFVAEGSVDMGPYWADLRSIPEAGSLGLALPRFLLRLPYGPKTSGIEAFAFDEMPEAPVHAAYLWGNPALACLALIARGGADLNFTGLPLHLYQKDGETESTPCAEVLMTEDQVRALMETGMMPLVSYRDTDRVRLAGFRAIDGSALPCGLE
ncbi:MAG TPA: type VI secretion system contractile sheath large subunit [Bryobacteraceae bacterium]|jgi:type VI secretion system protein ImpC